MENEVSQVTSFFSSDVALTSWIRGA